MTDSDIPDEPVRKVTVEHEDGTTRTLDGKHAQVWVAFVAHAVEYMKRHGGEPPEVEWEQYEG